MKNNFKRCLALLLALMTIVGAFSIPVSAADECDHDYEEIIKAPTCTTVGYTTRVCKICDESEIVDIKDKLSHNYQKATTAKKPTCSTPGYDKGAMVCKNCGDVKDNIGYQAPVADNHVFDGQIKKLGPTCGSGSVQPVVVYKWCTECSPKNKDNATEGWIQVGTEVARPDHDFDEVIVTPVKCGKDGKVVKTCKFCGFTVDIVIKAAAHDTEGVKEVLLTSNIKIGNTEYKYTKDTHVWVKYCRVCGGAASARTEAHTYVAPADEDKFVDACKNPGYYYKTCSICKRAEKVSVEDPKVMESNQTRHSINLNDPIATVDSYHKKDGITAGYSLYECYLCDAVVKIYDVGQGYADQWHTPYADNTKMVLKNTTESYVAPTCTDKGLGRFICSDGCGYEILYEIKATGHKYNTPVEENKDNCLKGYVKYEVCKVCGYKHILDQKDPVATTGKHALVKGDKVAATCFEAGYQAWKCNICGEHEDKREPIKKLTGHSNKYTYTDNGQTGCFVEREVYTYCSICKKKNTTKELYNGHLYDESKGPSVLDPATCNTTGKLGYSCTRTCIGVGKSVTKLSDAKEKCGGKHVVDTIPFDKDNHTGGKTAALTDGVYKYNLSGTEETIPLIEGKLTDITIAKTGEYAKYDCYELCYTWWYCEGCDKEFELVSELLDSNGDPIKDANGNTYKSGSVKHYFKPDYTVSNEHKNYVKPTCEDNGLAANVCQECGYRVENVVIPATGHDIKGVTPTATVPTTCIKLGYKVYVCKNAGCTVTVNDTKLADHTFVADNAANADKWTVTKKPTCAVKGSKYTVCTVAGCSERKTVEIALVPHGTVDANGDAKVDNFKHEYKAATCTETGYDYYKCLACNALYEYDSNSAQKVVTTYTVAKALGHTDTRNPATSYAKTPVAPTCASDGYTPNFCDDCNLERFWNNYKFATGHVAATNQELYDAGKLTKVPSAEDADKLYVGKAAATCFKYAYTYNICKVCFGECNEVFDTTSVKPPHVNADGYPLVGDCRIILGDEDCDGCNGTGIISSTDQAVVAVKDTDNDGYCDDCIEYYTCANVRADGTTPCGAKIPSACEFVNAVEYIECNAIVSACKFCGKGHTEKINDALPYDHDFEVTVAPTTTTEGVEVCKDCGYENPDKIAKLPAVVFEMVAENPNGSVLVNGGEIAVTIKMSVLDPAGIYVNNIRLSVMYDTAILKFVSVENGSTVFGAQSVPVSNAANGIATVFDDAGGERNNVLIEGDDEYVTLLFYVLPNANFNGKNRLDSIISFVDVGGEHSNDVAYYDVEAEEYKGYAFDVTTHADCDLSIDKLGDFTNDGLVNNYDLVAVRDAIYNGNEYDAVLDINHDGEITVADYIIIKEYMVGTYKYWQFADLESFDAYVVYATKAKEEVTEANYTAWLK